MYSRGIFAPLPALQLYVPSTTRAANEGSPIHKLAFERAKMFIRFHRCCPRDLNTYPHARAMRNTFRAFESRLVSQPTIAFRKHAASGMSRTNPLYCVDDCALVVE